MAAGSRLKDGEGVSAVGKPLSRRFPRTIGSRELSVLLHNDLIGDSTAGILSSRSNDR
jgi:hypothetical protein